MFNCIISIIFNIFISLSLYIIYYIIRVFRISVFYNFVLLYNLYLYFYNNITFSLFINRLLNKVCYLFYFLFLNIILILIIYSLFFMYFNTGFSLKTYFNLSNSSLDEHYAAWWRDGLPKLSNKHPYLFPAYNSVTKLEYNTIFQLELYYYPTVGDFVKDTFMRNNIIHRVFPPLAHKAHVNLKIIDATLEGNGIVIPERLLHPQDPRDIDLVFNTTKRGSFYEYAKKVQHSLNLDYITKEMASGRFDQSKTPLENSYNPEVRKELTFVTRDSRFFSNEFSDEFKSIITAEIRLASKEAIAQAYFLWTNPEAYTPDWNMKVMYGNAVPGRTMKVLLDSVNMFIYLGLKKNPEITPDMLESFLQIRSEVVYISKDKPNFVYNSKYYYDLSRIFFRRPFDTEAEVAYYTAKIPMGTLLQNIRSNSNCYVSGDTDAYVKHIITIQEDLAGKIVAKDALLAKTVADLEAQYYNILEFKKGAGQEYPISLFNHNFFN